MAVRGWGLLGLCDQEERGFIYILHIFIVMEDQFVLAFDHILVPRPKHRFIETCLLSLEVLDVEIEASNDVSECITAESIVFTRRL